MYPDLTKHENPPVSPTGSLPEVVSPTYFAHPATHDPPPQYNVVDSTPVSGTYYSHQPVTVQKARANPMVVCLQICFSCCACLFLLCAVTFGVSALVFQGLGNVTVDTSSYNENTYDIPFQRPYQVNGIISADGTFNMTIEAGYVLEDLGKMRMCLDGPINLSGEAQAMVPPGDFRYDDIFSIDMCSGDSAIAEDGLALCSTADIYATVYGRAGTEFTLKLFYDYCHTDYETCYCDYFVIYLSYFLIVIFSVVVSVVCACCTCCCSSCCMFACCTVTVVDSQSRKNVEALPLITA